MKKLVSLAISVLMLAAVSSIAVSAAEPVRAYIDPSVTTVFIQAFAGIAVVIGAAVAVIWKKAKKKVAKTLNIDENAKKEQEEDIVVFDEETAPSEEEKNETAENGGQSDNK